MIVLLVLSQLVFTVLTQHQLQKPHRSLKRPGGRDAALQLSSSSSSAAAAVQPGGLGEFQWLHDLKHREDHIFSQNGEDGILAYIFDRLHPLKSYFVEFGTRNGDECNTRVLQEKKGWTGLRMDAGFDIPKRFLKREFITPDNIVDLFVKYRCVSSSFAPPRRRHVHHDPRPACAACRSRSTCCLWTRTTTTTTSSTASCSATPRGSSSSRCVQCSARRVVHSPYRPL